MPNVQNINFQAPTDYGAEEASIARQRMLAQILAQQGMQPLPEQPTAGGYTVPISPLNGLAKMLNSYAGMQGENVRERVMPAAEDASS